MGQQGPRVQKGGCEGAKKMTFFKNDPGPHGMPKQVFMTRFEPVVAVLASPKSQNALKMGCFGTNNGSKMGQNCVFPKMILDHLGCLNK